MFLPSCAAQMEVLLEPTFHSGKEAVVKLLAGILGKLHTMFPPMPADDTAAMHPAREAAEVITISAQCVASMNWVLFVYMWLAEHLELAIISVCTQLCQCLVCRFAKKTLHCIALHLQGSGELSNADVCPLLGICWTHLAECPSLQNATGHASNTLKWDC